MPGPLMIHDMIARDGVTAVNVWCRCGHEAQVDVRGWPDMPVQDTLRRLRCSHCGARPNQVMPAWEQRPRLGR